MWIRQSCYQVLTPRSTALPFHLPPHAPLSTGNRRVDSAHRKGTCSGSLAGSVFCFTWSLGPEFFFQNKSGGLLVTAEGEFEVTEAQYAVLTQLGLPKCITSGARPPCVCRQGCPWPTVKVSGTIWLCSAGPSLGLWGTPVPLPTSLLPH